MKKVLIVDDSRLVRNFFLKKLERYNDKIEVQTAENGEHAIEVIKEFKPMLVMTDLEMPVMDGFELLAYMTQNHPKIPMFVMTAKGSPEIRERINGLGSIKYFEKPLDIDELAEMILSELSKGGAKGKLQGIMLVSFLQLVEVEGKTCTLTVSAEGRKGTLCCEKGRLLNARVNDLKGLGAAYEMIRWDNAVIEISNTLIDNTAEIDMPMVNIIMEGLNRKDESSGD